MAASFAISSSPSGDGCDAEGFEDGGAGMVWVSGIARYRMAADYRSRWFRDFVDMQYVFVGFRLVVCVVSLNVCILRLPGDT